MVYIRIIILFFGLGVVLPVSVVSAQDIRENDLILIISSYNPETSQTSSTISAFMDEYKYLGGKSEMIIENLNCKSLPDAVRWKKQMGDILKKYQGNKTPSLVLLLGQEAWTSYFSLDDYEKREFPILCGMASRNAVLLPDSTINLEEWAPESVDMEREFNGKVNVAGFIYEYDVVANVRLIRNLYPATQSIAFISDNSYGGVAMQAYVKKEMKEKFPDMDLILLDGRKHSIYTLVDQIALLPKNTVILIGTWRVDKNEGYFMRNATYSMMSANPNLPAFSLSSIGLGHWVIGGYQPLYRNTGKDLALQAIKFQRKDEKEPKLQAIPNEYVFDYSKLNKLDIDLNILPSYSRFVNKEESFVEKYRYQIWGGGVIVGVIVLAFIITLYYFIRTKRLKDELLHSKVQLLAAKERAEESDRLKSAFLANMSHEIRTPLNAIVGFSNVLISSECSLEEQKEFVEVIQANSDLLLRLINDVLDISRLETGRLSFNYELYDMVTLCQHVLATTSHLKKPGVEYVFKPCADSYIIETDVQRLQQVLINLLSNASKFTTEGSITLQFEEDLTKQALMFSVTDTGCGIPEDKRQKVFERFEKLNEYAQGTGLGLAICKITVNILGGSIWIDKSYQEGARFVFSHPLLLPNKK